MALSMEALEKILSDLRKTGGIEACAVASRDGLLIRANMPKGYHAETFAAMSATMLGAAETAIIELKKGIPERVIVESNHGKLIAVGAGPKALLIIQTSHDAPLGLVLLEVEKAEEKVKTLLG